LARLRRFSLTAPAPPALFTLSLHDALPIFERLDGALVAAFAGFALDFLQALLPAVAGGDRGHRALGGVVLLGHGEVRSMRAQAEDRKSTRLNSSHRTISYAVFCLKKKKNQS